MGRPLQERFTLALLILATLTPAFVGCDRQGPELGPKAPRPVAVAALKKQTPGSAYRVSGAVKSWKTEEIGFEVSGRVLWVLEPGEVVKQHIVGPDGTVLREGTALAKIDPARYEIAVESANAQLEVATLNKEATEVRVTESLPADLRAAEADLQLAQTEYDRVKQLERQNAASKSERDRARNSLQQAKSREASAQAVLRQAQAELKAAEAEIKRASQAVDEAKRDLKNTVLYASYRGQIANVRVVPGSVVSPGSPVLTLEMMDPIKIDVEVSADQSRQLHQHMHVPITYELPDGTSTTENAYLYNIDSGADATTRTFSLTLLHLNRRVSVTSQIASAETAAITKDVWPLRLNQVLGAPEDRYFVEDKAIYEENGEHFIYKMQNAQMGGDLPDTLKASKVKVTPQEFEIPFIGIWTFREIVFDETEDPSPLMLVAGEIESDSQWDGKTLVVDGGSQWELRPGDLVSVDLSGTPGNPGFYVPDSAIYDESGKASVFVVEGSDSAATVRSLPVEVVMPEGLSADPVVEIRSEKLSEDMLIVVEGVHYLMDGEPVQVVQRSEAKQ